MESGTVEPYFWIFESYKHVSPAETFVVGSVTVGFESSIEICSLIVREEFGF